jgi:membrane protein implicated in regulation of membrane protease activity
MGAWLVWLVLVLALAVGEIATPGLFVLGPIALAGLAPTALALAGFGVAVQLVAFIAAAGASLALLRPVARAHLRQPAALRTGTAALEGASAVVLERVDADGGRVKLAGEVWSARSYLDDQVMNPGERVHVVRIQGATALVHT